MHIFIRFGFFDVDLSSIMLEALIVDYRHRFSSNAGKFNKPLN
jgi:hypothetical protein